MHKLTNQSFSAQKFQQADDESSPGKQNRLRPAIPGFQLFHEGVPN